MSSIAAARCQHIKVSGTQCGSPALRSKNFCFYHQQNRPLTVECYSEQQCKFRPFPKVSKAKKGAENREVRAKSHALKTLSLTLRRSSLWQGMCAKLLIPIDRGKGGGVERRRVQNPARRSSTVPQQQISSDKEKEHHRNHAVHSEERRVQLTQIIVADQHVFVQQKRGHGDHSHHRQLTKSKHNDQCNQQPEHHDVKQTGDDERISDSEKARQRVQAMAEVVVMILTSVDHVESTDPERHCGGEQQNPRIERPANRDPRGRRRNP